MASPPIRRRVRIRGRVQGVFFRDSCRQEAERLGVGGWVRNTPDGLVEATFEGSQQAVDEMVGWCRRGPDQADVDGVEVDTERVVGESDFTVR